MEAVLIILVFAVAVVLAYYLAYRPASSKDVGNTTKVTIGKAVVNAEVADTLPKMMTGLMFRKSLPEKNGMLFLFGSDGYHGIWMPNMSFPIDIIWMDSEKRIVDIVKDAQPCGMVCSSVYRPGALARYVLEVNSGFADKYGIEVGDKSSFSV